MKYHLYVLFFCFLQFGKYQPYIDQITDQTTLPMLIQERKEQILSIKTHWKEKLLYLPFYLDQTKLQKILKTGSLRFTNLGCGSSYFLYDEIGIPRYVIKPVDEDLLCLNNRKQFASPFYNHIFRARTEIPLYRTAQAEALSFAVAEVLGFSDLTPKTDMMILTHESFYDISTETEKSDKEKLCSVQEYLDDIVNLQDLAAMWMENQIEENRILQLIDSESFENLYLLIWLLYDNDAHIGNLYAKLDESGIFHLVKIDNGLTFPEKNRNFLNDLFFLPHAKLPPSERLRQIVKDLPVEKIIEKIQLFEMFASIEAFRQRVIMLQNLFSRPNLSFREIDVRLNFLP